MAAYSSPPPPEPLGLTDSPPAPSVRPKQSGLIAPMWHTVAILVLLLGLSGLSAWKGSASPAASRGEYGRALNYATVFVWEWLTVAFIAWGVRLRGNSLSGLIAGGWPNATAMLRDLRVAGLFLIGSDVILSLLHLAAGDKPNQALRDLLPQTPLETTLWFGLAATAGFCEEVIFRGYLQNQLARLTGNLYAGMALQALIFGVSHSYQGWKAAAIIAVYGAMFGWLAIYRVTLRPGMIAHFLQDGIGGMIAREGLKHLPK